MTGGKPQRFLKIERLIEAFQKGPVALREGDLNAELQELLPVSRSRRVIVDNESNLSLSEFDDSKLSVALTPKEIISGIKALYRRFDANIIETQSSLEPGLFEQGSSAETRTVGYKLNNADRTNLIANDVIDELFNIEKAGEDSKQSIRYAATPIILGIDKLGQTDFSLLAANLDNGGFEPIKVATKAELVTTSPANNADDVFNYGNPVQGLTTGTYGKGISYPTQSSSGESNISNILLGPDGQFSPYTFHRDSFGGGEITRVPTNKKTPGYVTVDISAVGPGASGGPLIKQNPNNTDEFMTLGVVAETARTVLGKEGHIVANVMGAPAIDNIIENGVVNGEPLGWSLVDITA